MTPHPPRRDHVIRGDHAIRSDHPESVERHRLIGIGVGPGDPELVTVKAVRLLREADLVIVPVMDGPAAGRAPEIGRAESTVLAYVPAGHVQRAVFALDERAGVTSRRERAWEAAADAVLAAFDVGARTVAFATIGDPNVYSTFTYLAATVAERRPEVDVSTVPGITAMQDLAARSGTVLCEGREPLTLLPMTAGVEAFEAAVAGTGTVVAYKGWRRYGELVAVLHRQGRLADAVVGSGLGLPDERVAAVAEVPVDLREEEPDDRVLPYLTTVLVPARRDRRGGKL
jgi:precorrin-2/cobalt-factor-2 C20-methyltransferase